MSVNASTNLRRSFLKRRWRRQHAMPEPSILNRHRDPNGELGRQHGNTLICTLRKTYGPNFARGCGDNQILGDVLGRLDEASLAQLVRDHDDGRLAEICAG